MSGGRLLSQLRDQLHQQSKHRVPSEPPDLSGYTNVDVEAARLQWLNRVVQEHRSVVDYANLLSLLADIDAPYDALCGVERVLSDEMRHVAYCRQMVAWLGGDADIELDLTNFPRRPRPEDGLLEHAILRVTEEIYIAEEASLPILKVYVRACTEPTVEAVLRILLEDEGMHSAIGKAVRDQLLAMVDSQERDAVAARMKQREHAAREAMWNIHRMAATDAPGRELGGSITVADVDQARASSSQSVEAADIDARAT